MEMRVDHDWKPKTGIKPKSKAITYYCANCTISATEREIRTTVNPNCAGHMPVVF